MLLPWLIIRFSPCLTSSITELARANFSRFVPRLSEGVFSQSFMAKHFLVDVLISRGALAKNSVVVLTDVPDDQYRRAIKAFMAAHAPKLANP